MVERVPQEEQGATAWAELDVRSLALLRILLGTLVLVSCVLLLPDLRSFYTDEGVFSRLELVRSPLSDFWLSLHLGGGDLLTQVILVLLLASCACALIVGWRTPWMVATCWFLLNSLYARNPFVNDRGDMELALVLFWSFFLPLGARWSLDAKAGRTAFGDKRGVPAAALILQFAQIYLFAGLLKNGPFWLARGDGLYYSLQSPLFATDLAYWLAESLPRTALFLLNYSVVAGELFLAFLLLCPFAVRLLRSFAIALIVVFHLSVLLLFKLGSFPLIGALLPLALLPAGFWEGIGRPLQARLDARFGERETELRRCPVWTRVLVGTCILLALLSNLAFRVGEPAFERPTPLRALSQGLRLEQHWELFAPVPPYIGTFQIQRASESGGYETLLRIPKKPNQSDAVDFPNHRWRMLMISSLYPIGSPVRRGIVAEWLKREGFDLKGSFRFLFELRLVNEKGELLPSTVWTLWSGTL